jgi:3'-phosphoadenosine 5'-phosphosulfate sulfotransferase (PAPS reductase)/FAD synthetase
VPAITHDWRAQYRAWAQTAGYQRRVAQAVEIIHRADASGVIALAMSWGKDSVAVADLTLRTLGRRVPAYHMASSYELPGSDHVVAYFRERTDVEILPAKRTADEMIEWLREVGLGYERTRASRRAASAPKKSGGDEWCAKHGYDITVLGMRADEAVGRRKLFTVRGPIYERSSGARIACPLAWWDTRDVWAYIVAHDVPYHRIYDCESHGYTRETLRNAGWLTTTGAGLGRIAWLAHHYPAEYRRLADAFPRVRSLR